MGELSEVAGAEGDTVLRTLALDVAVYIVVTGACVRVFVMRYVVDLVLPEESLVDYPRRFIDDLIDPSTVPYGL